MQRFYQNKQELFINKPCDLLIPTPQGFRKVHFETLTESVAELLCVMGLIQVIEVDERKEVKKERKNISYYVRRFGNRKGLDRASAYQLFNVLITIAPTAAFQIVLKEIALELDKKYPDHIRESKEIYVISTLNGQIYCVDKNRIVNYNNFAAFRSPEEAQYAIDVLGDFFKDLFEESKPVTE